MINVIIKVKVIKVMAIKVMVIKVMEVRRAVHDLVTVASQNPPMHVEGEQEEEEEEEEEEEAKLVHGGQGKTRASPKNAFLRGCHPYFFCIIFQFFTYLIIHTCFASFFRLFIFVPTIIEACHIVSPALGGLSSLSISRHCISNFSCFVLFFLEQSITFLTILDEYY